LNAISDRLTVGQEVVEIIFDNLPGVRLLSQGHGKRQRPAEFPTQPLFAIGKLKLPTGSSSQTANRPAIHEYMQVR
jgi:hypothetical protein